MNLKKLSDLRAGIDKIDSDLIRLMNKRGELSCMIGDIKHKKGQPVYSPDRESQIYKKVKQKNKGPLPDGSLKAI